MNNNNNDNFIKEIDDAIANNTSNLEFEVPEGYTPKFITQEEYEAKLQNKKNQSDGLVEKKKQVNNMREFIKDNEFGRFFHMIYKYNQPIFEELRETISENKMKITIVRFIVLVAHITLYGETKNTIATLQKVWDVSNKDNVKETRDMLLNYGFIQVTDDGFITINEGIVREKVKDYIKELQKDNNNYTYTRVFCESILNLYYGIDEQRKRQQLAYLYTILPYINFKYNRLCSNPTETDNLKIKPLNWVDLCDICKYNKKNPSRLRDILMSLKIKGQGVFIEVTGENNKKVIIVNPHIYYAGNNIKELKAIMDIFDSFAKNN